jgi:hypothetical protein
MLLARLSSLHTNPWNFGDFEMTYAVNSVVYEEKRDESESN